MMAEIRNYTLNFSFGRSCWSLNFPFVPGKLACTEIELNVAKVQHG